MFKILLRPAKMIWNKLYNFLKLLHHCNRDKVNLEQYIRQDQITDDNKTIDLWLNLCFVLQEFWFQL